MLERRSEDELRTRLRQQAAVTELGRRALAGTPVAELKELAVQAIADDLGTPLVGVMEPGDEEGAFVFTAGIGADGDIVAELAARPDFSGQPAYTLAEGGPVVSRDLEHEDRFVPSKVLLRAGVRSTASVPVGPRGAPVAVLGVASRRVDDFSAEDVNFIEAVANTLAAAAARELAETTLQGEQERLRAALAHVSESEARFRDLADSAPVFIWTTDAEGMITFVNQGWLDFTGTTLQEELGDTFTLNVHPEDADALRSSWWRAFRRRVPWECEYRLRRHDGEYRWIIDRGVPRLHDDELLGFVGTSVDIHERKESEDRLSAAFERDHDIAETLQRSLLPERLPRIDGVALEARYLPAARDTAIGGDWYDAIELSDGRIALVVGDVVGHGLRAAAVMGQLRNAFRAYALIESSPAATLGRLNRLLAVEERDVMATALGLVLDRDSGDVTYSSAGHPPALVIEDRSARFLEGGRSVPLGTADPIAYGDATDHIAPGATLVLYTDGLVERRDTPLDDRLAQLSAVARVGVGELENLCDEILGGMLGGARPPDDVALLAVRPQPARADLIEMRLPAEPAALVSLRRRLGRFLTAAGASDEERYEITLTICEAAANAIEHAYGPRDAEFDVRLRVDRGEVVADVVDNGRWRDQRGNGAEGQTRGRGLAIIEALVDELRVVPSAGGTTVHMRRRLGIGVSR